MIGWASGGASSYKANQSNTIMRTFKKSLYSTSIGGEGNFTGELRYVPVLAMNSRMQCR